MPSYDGQSVEKVTAPSGNVSTSWATVSAVAERLQIHTRKALPKLRLLNITMPNISTPLRTYTLSTTSLHSTPYRHKYTPTCHSSNPVMQPKPTHMPTTKRPQLPAF